MKVKRIEHFYILPMEVKKFVEHLWKVIWQHLSKSKMHSVDKIPYLGIYPKAKFTHLQ